MRGDMDVKYIRITDFNDFGIVVGTAFVTAEVIRPEFLLHNEDVLFARSGATAGKTFIYVDDIGPAIFAGYCIRFVFDKARVLPWYVYLYTKTRAYRAWVRAMQRPSGQPNINKEEFKSLSIPVPSIATQQRLTSAMQEARESRKRKLAEAEALLKGMDEFLIQAIGLREPREVAQGAYCVHLRQVKVDKRLNAEYFHPERIAAIQAIRSGRNVVCTAPLMEVVDFVREVGSVAKPDHYVGLANVQSHSGELAPMPDEEVKGQHFRFEAGDVLFARLRPYLNKVWCAEEAGTCSTEFHVMRIRHAGEGDKRVLPDYLAAVLRSSITVKQTKHMMTGNTHPRLANEDVVNLLVPIVSEKLQSTIVEEFTRRRTHARNLRVEAEREWEAAKAWFEEQLLGKITR